MRNLIPITSIICCVILLIATACVKKPASLTNEVHPDRTFVAAAAKALSTVAWIQNVDNAGNVDTSSTKHGSGIIISPEGHIVTNYHVVQGNQNIHVTLTDRSQFLATFIGADSTMDIAVIRIEVPDLQYLEFGNSDSLLVGQQVIAVGNPHRQQSTVQSGIISALNRPARLPNNRSPYFIQTDIPIANGSSGGGLLDVHGRLMGIMIGMISTTGAYEGISLGVPGNIVKHITDQIIEFGESRRATLKMVMIRNVEEDDKQAAGLSTFNGVVIHSLEAGTAADVAGLRSLDIITSFDGSPVINTQDFKGRLATQRPGDVVKLGVNRSGKEMVIEVKLD